jgi:Domain of unknown function (DUF4403)
MARRSIALVAVLALSSCSGLLPVYPPRPPATPGEPIADPAPSRIVVHATVTGAALRKALDEKVPQTGAGTVPIFGSSRHYTFKREPIGLRFERDRVGVDIRVNASIEQPIGSMDFPIDVHVAAEPVVTSEYVVKLQAVDVAVASPDRRLKIADWIGGVFDKIKSGIEDELRAFAYDLRPELSELYARVSKPIALPLGDASGCAMLDVVGVEAGPTVIADGLEKDLALVVAPSVLLPCPEAEEAPPALPPLANVATLESGPFTVTVPIAARYEELAKAMALAFTDGKLFFSKDYPELYMEKPEVYASAAELVLKLHIGGTVRGFVDTDINGDIFFAGHPEVEDNELRVPDLEPTVQTKNLLLLLKATLDGDKIRAQARDALRLDLSEKLAPVREQLSTGLDFGDGRGCLKADADKIEITGVHVHKSYLRLYVAVTGRAALRMPCAQ